MKEWLRPGETLQTSNTIVSELQVAIIIHFGLHNTEAVALSCPVKKGVLKNFVKFIWKHLCHIFLSKKEILLWHRCFSVDFCEIFKDTFFYRTPPVAASDNILLSLIFMH